MKLARFGLRIAGGEVCSFVDDGADVLVDLLQPFLVGVASFGQPLADKLDTPAPYFAMVLVPGWERRP